MKKSKILIKKIAVCFFLLVFVFNFSFVYAQEATTQEVIEPQETAPDTIFGENPITSTNEDVINEENQLTDVPSLDEETTTLDETTSTEPIIFEFPQPQEENTSNVTDTPDVVLENNIEQVEEVVTENATNETGISSYNIPTGIIRGLNISQPTIIGQWQMLDRDSNNIYQGIDESAGDGSQILPSGQFQVDRKIALCAIMANSLDNELVTAKINYPQNVAFDDGAEQKGCGQEKSQVELAQINKNEAVSLVCEAIRNSNNNLVSWNKDKVEGYTYGYEQMCGPEGALVNETTSVFCGTSALSYNEPAGDYKITVEAKNSQEQVDVAESSLKYMELTIFENDFSEIQYGIVKLNQWKTLKGDLFWGSGSLPTVRNIGNTRLNITIWQNDFGFGRTSDLWNLEYRAKIGEQPDSDIISYLPEQTTILNNPLEVGQSLNIDFSILVRKFLEASDQISFAGQMTLAAEQLPGLICQQ